MTFCEHFMAFGAGLTIMFKLSVSAGYCAETYFQA
jgi:hypothetical protein